jgi:uncharacterized protein
MKKRLRKKLHREEFSEFGLDLLGVFTQDLTEEGLEVFMDWILDMASSLGYIAGGGFGQKSFGLHVIVGRQSDPVSERISDLRRSMEHPLIKKCCWGPLQDSWSGDYKDVCSSCPGDPGCRRELLAVKGS